LEVHRLIRDTPLCSKPDPDNVTTLYVEFADYSSFRSAKRHWANRDDLLFAAEDASCAAGAGDRSVYRATSAAFHEGPGIPLSARITGIFQRVAWYDSGVATEVTFSLQSVSSFRERNAHTFAPAKRARRDIIPDLPFSSILPDFESLATSVVGQVTSKVGDLMDEIFEKIEDLTEGEFEASFELQINENLDGDQRVTPLEGLQDLNIFPKFTFINTYVDINVRFYFTLKFNILDRGGFDELDGEDETGKFGSFVGTHASEVRIGMEATKDIKIGLQTELYIPGGYEWFCAFLLFPGPAPLACGHVLIIGQLPTLVHPFPGEFPQQKLDNTRDPLKKSPGLTGWEVWGVKFLMTAGIQLWTRIGAHADVNM
jgi:hypothetical protein